MNINMKQFLRSVWLASLIGFGLLAFFLVLALLGALGPVVFLFVGLIIAVHIIRRPFGGWPKDEL